MTKTDFIDYLLGVLRKELEDKLPNEEATECQAIDEAAVIIDNKIEHVKKELWDAWLLSKAAENKDGGA